MNLSMSDHEKMYLETMGDGTITARVANAYACVRAALMKTGFGNPLDKQMLAIIHTMGQVGWNVHATNGHATTDNQPLERANGDGFRSVVPPTDDLGKEGWGKAADRYAQASAMAANGGEYTGPRIKWENKFKSIPGDPPALWEKGRPITYIDTETGVALGARFVRVNPKDKKTAYVANGTKKKAFPVPITTIRLNDLSPPSPVPAAVAL